MSFEGTIKLPNAKEKEKNAMSFKNATSENAPFASLCQISEPYSSNNKTFFYQKRYVSLHHFIYIIVFKCSIYMLFLKYSTQIIDLEYSIYMIVLNFITSFIVLN